MNNYSEERAAHSLLVTTQLNRKRPKPPPSPELPNQMMSNERKIRVQVLYQLNQILFLFLQLNYEFLRKCVASGPVTPMGSASWENILSYIPAKYISNPRMQPLIKELDQEIHQQYEETIRKTTSKLGESLYCFYATVYFIVQMMLVKPTVNGLTPDPELYKEPLYVARVNCITVTICHAVGWTTPHHGGSVTMKQE